MIKRWSLSRRLSTTLIVGVAGLWLIAVTAAILVVSDEMSESLDSVLQETAQRLLSLAVDDLLDQEAAGDAHEIRGALAVEAHDEYLIYQLRDAGGRMLIRSHDAPNEPFPVPLAVGFADAGDWRFYTEPTDDGRMFMQVAEPLEHRQEALVEILSWLTAPLALLIPLAGVIILVAVRRMLAPIAGVREAIAARGGSDLSPVPDDGMPVELAPIVGDVNRLMQRLAQAFESERAFAANSAHELRTPVAAALAQLSRLSADLHGTASVPRVEQIAAILQGLGRKIEKLLQLSRAEAGIALRRQPVDLIQVVELLVDEFRHDERGGGRLELDIASDEPVIVETDIDALAIALRNLIENALVHGSATAPVRVSVAADRTMRVSNEGAVVPPERLTKLTQRFERGAAETAGSGLGLAIADAIIHQAGGRLELRSPMRGRDDGFEAVVHFPAIG